MANSKLSEDMQEQMARLIEIEILSQRIVLLDKQIQSHNEKKEQNKECLSAF